MLATAKMHFFNLNVLMFLVVLQGLSLLLKVIPITKPGIRKDFFFYIRLAQFVSSRVASSVV